MLNKSQVRTQTNQNKNRAMVIAVLVCFIIASLLSKIFVLTNANHKHDCNSIDGTCPICIEMQNAKSIIRQFGAALICAAFDLFKIFVLRAIGRIISLVTAVLTPISLKIRMNN